MSLHDVARNTESETCAAGIAIARCLDAIEGLEYALQFFRRNAWAVVLNDDEQLVTIRNAYQRVRSVLGGVVQQIGKASFQLLCLADEGIGGMTFDRKARA